MQDLASSQQGTPEAHASRPSAVGGLQHGSVLAGVSTLQQDQSVTAHSEPDTALALVTEMPASSDLALGLSPAQTSWQVEAATVLQHLPMPAKRPAEEELDDACREFFAKRQRLGRSL